jgi:hypothetical protein
MKRFRVEKIVARLLLQETRRRFMSLESTLGRHSWARHLRENMYLDAGLNCTIRLFHDQVAADRLIASETAAR